VRVVGRECQRWALVCAMEWGHPMEWGHAMECVMECAMECALPAMELEHGQR
jgi:hypothetical protein